MRPIRVYMLGAVLAFVAPAVFAATTFTVNSLGDEPDNPAEPPGDTACSTAVGTCTLRAALQQATKTGSAGGPYTINFTAPFVITLTNGTLPDVREQTTINGTSAPGFAAGVLMVQINGNAAATTGLSLTFNASNSIIKGLVIRNMTSDGIDIGVNGVNVTQCFIGTDVTGTSSGTGNANKGHGIAINGATNAIGGLIPGPLTLGGTGNVISGNSNDGILIFSVQSVGNTVRNNFIGTNVLGTAALGNGSNGVEISGSATGTNAGDANVISGNGFHGVLITGSSFNTVYANHIGTDITGAVALGNGTDGVHIDSGSNNEIGGLTVAQRNVISGNGNDGVQITSGADSNMVQGNFIGTNGISTGAIPNIRFGVFLGSNTNQITGTLIVAPQVISGNIKEGIFISGSNNSINSNNIGEDLGGAPVPNGGAGITVINGGISNILRPNNIGFNGGLGIDLTNTVSADGVTPNDPLDPDTGGNNLQNFPVITSAINNGGTVTVTGTLNSEPNSAPFPYLIDFYYNDAPDPSTFGEGQTIDSNNTQTNTDAAGNGGFTRVLNTNVPIGKFITATASGPFGTSEFSLAVPVTAPSADLSVTKVDSPDPVNAGANLTFTITLANAGPSAASNVVLSDTLPAGTTFQSLTPAAGYSCNSLTVGAGGTLTCTNPSFASGANAVFTLVVKVDSNIPAATVITNTATASSSTPDPNAANNSGTSTTTVAVAADLSVTKSGPPIANAGTNLTYTVTMTNNGPSDAANPNVTDVVPANTTFVSASAPPAFSPCTTPAVGGTGTISCTATTLAAGANAVFTFVVKLSPSATGFVTNSATVSSTTPDPDNTNNTSIPANTEVTTSADLSVTKSGSPNPVIAGTNLTFTVTVMNNGPSDAQTVTLTDVLPASVTFVSETVPLTFICTPPAVGTNGTITCSATSMAAGASAVFNFVVQVASSTANGATISNTATASAVTADPTPGNNSSTSNVSVAASADVSVTKVDTPDPVTAGSNITYTVTVANAGPSDAQGVTLNDTTPANTTFVSTTAPAYSCTSPAVGGTGAISCTATAALAAGANNQITIVVNVNGATSAGTVISNSATAASTTTDPTPANNTGTATTTVSAVVLNADVGVTKTGSPNPVNAGTNLTYTVTVTNAGPDPATGVALNDALPAITRFVSLTSPAGYSCTSPAVGANGTITCSNPSVASGANNGFTIVVSVDPAAGAGSTISNTATVTTTSTDSNNANNSATATTTVATSADLAVTKTGSPNPVNAGANITYTVTVNNAGPSDATTVTLTDNTPAFTTFVSATAPAGFTCTVPAVGGTGAINCMATNLIAGASPVFTFVVQVGAATPNGTVITNTALAAAATSDPNAGNNSGSATTTVNAVAVNADLAITKTGAPNPVAAGANLTYTIVVTNNGPGAATSASMGDTTPANTTFVSLAAPAGYTCTAPAVGGTGAISCNNPTLANGATGTFTLVVQVGAAVPNGTNITNTATISSATTDPNPANNSAVVVTPVSSAALTADLGVTKSGTPSTVAPGANITYTVSVANAGPNSATNAGLTDNTPANTTFVSVTAPAGFSCVAPAVGGTGAITCNDPTLANGANATFTIVVNVNAATPSGTTITNTATVTSSTTDSNAGNNSATATTSVLAVGVNVPAASPLMLMLLAMTLAAAGWFISRK